jgi:hypothetical protein
MSDRTFDGFDGHMAGPLTEQLPQSPSLHLVVKRRARSVAGHKIDSVHGQARIAERSLHRQQCTSALWIGRSHMVCILRQARADQPPQYSLTALSGSLFRLENDTGCCLTQIDTATPHIEWSTDLLRLGTQQPKAADHKRL